MNAAVGPSRHRYSLAALRGDGLRALVGIALSLFVLMVVETAAFAFYLFLALLAVFAAFGLQLVERALTTVELGPLGIRAFGPRARSIAWAELTKVKLSYYRARRRSRDGWMQLTLKGKGGALALDSTIDDFAAIARAVHQASLDRGLELSDASRANFAALGLAEAGWGAPASWTRTP